MLTWLKQRQDRRQKARCLYGSIVTQARSPGFYAACGVPDTAEGRFETIVLHLVLVLHRLAGAGDPGRQLGRLLTEVFVTDVDDTLREMTVGDLAVPRHVKRAVAALHDRHGAYGVALAASDDGPLTEAILARLAGGPGADGDLDAVRLCGYMRRAKRGLDLLPGIEVLAGRVAWPQIDGLDTTCGRSLDDGGGHAR
jgi:cytochrome b pre-mRNA-processing protein 3